jgi:hypothetical protein
MSDAVLFGIIFVGFFVLRIIAATIFFYFILPDEDRCPNCDTPTVRVQSKGWNLLFPWFRTSWCYACNWEGLLRHGRVTPAPSRHEAAKQDNVNAS